MGNRLMVQEGHLLAVFNSAHRVMKAESILKTLRVPVLLIPAPRQLQTDCGLALRFSEDDRDIVMQTLEQEQLLPAFICTYRNGSFDTTWVNDANDAHDSTGDMRE